MTPAQVNGLLTRKGTPIRVTTAGRSVMDTATGRALRADPTVQTVPGAILPETERRDQASEAGAVTRTARILLAATDSAGAAFTAVIGQTLAVAGATFTIRSFTPYLQGLTTLAYDTRADS